MAFNAQKISSLFYKKPFIHGVLIRGVNKGLQIEIVNIGGNGYECELMSTCARQKVFETPEYVIPARYPETVERIRKELDTILHNDEYHATLLKHPEYYDYVTQLKTHFASIDDPVKTIYDYMYAPRNEFERDTSKKFLILLFDKMKRVFETQNYERDEQDYDLENIHDPDEIYNFDNLNMEAFGGKNDTTDNDRIEQDAFSDDDPDLNADNPDFFFKEEEQLLSYKHREHVTVSEPELIDEELARRIRQAFDMLNLSVDNLNINLRYQDLFNILKRSGIHDDKDEYNPIVAAYTFIHLNEIGAQIKFEEFIMFRDLKRSPNNDPSSIIYILTKKGFLKNQEDIVKLYIKKIIDVRKKDDEDYKFKEPPKNSRRVLISLPKTPKKPSVKKEPESNQLLPRNVKEHIKIPVMWYINSKIEEKKENFSTASWKYLLKDLIKHLQGEKGVFIRYYKKNRKKETHYKEYKRYIEPLIKEYNGRIKHTENLVERELKITNRLLKNLKSSEKSRIVGIITQNIKNDLVNYANSNYLEFKKIKKEKKILNDLQKNFNDIEKLYSFMGDPDYYIIMKRYIVLFNKELQNAIDLEKNVGPRRFLEIQNDVSIKEVKMKQAREKLRKVYEKEFDIKIKTPGFTGKVRDKINQTGRRDGNKINDTVKKNKGGLTGTKYITFATILSSFLSLAHNHKKKDIDILEYQLKTHKAFKTLNKADKKTGKKTDIKADIKAYIKKEIPKEYQEAILKDLDNIRNYTDAEIEYKKEAIKIKKALHKKELEIDKDMQDLKKTKSKTKSKLLTVKEILSKKKHEVYNDIFVLINSCKGYTPTEKKFLSDNLHKIRDFVAIQQLQMSLRYIPKTIKSITKSKSKSKVVETVDIKRLIGHLVLYNKLYRQKVIEIIKNLKRKI